MAHAVKVHSPPIPNFGILFMERHKNKSTNDSMLRVCLCSDILRQQEISPNSHACQNYAIFFHACLKKLHLSSV